MWRIADIIVFVCAILFILLVVENKNKISSGYIYFLNPSASYFLRCYTCGNTFWPKVKLDYTIMSHVVAEF